MNSPHTGSPQASERDAAFERVREQLAGPVDGHDQSMAGATADGRYAVLGHSDLRADPHGALTRCNSRERAAIVARALFQNGYNVLGMFDLDTLDGVESRIPKFYVLADIQIFVAFNTVAS